MPEYGTSVTMVVVAEWDILHCAAFVKERLDMFEEPGLVVAPNGIDLGV